MSARGEGSSGGEITRSRARNSGFGDPGRDDLRGNGDLRSMGADFDADMLRVLEPLFAPAPFFYPFFFSFFLFFS